MQEHRRSLSDAVSNKHSRALPFANIFCILTVKLTKLMTLKGTTNGHFKSCREFNMPIELKQNEEVLATDQVLHYSSSFFAHNADCWLTNQRLMLEPKKALDKLSGSKAEIQIIEISNIEKKSGMITIHHANGSLQIGGSGAERVGERLRMILDTISQGESSLEKVLFQGDTTSILKDL